MKKLSTILLLATIGLSAGIMQASARARGDSSGVWSAMGGVLVPQNNHDSRDNHTMTTTSMQKANKKLREDRAQYLAALDKAAKIVAHAPKVRERFREEADRCEELARLARERANIWDEASKQTTSTLGGHGIRIAKNSRK